MQNTSSWADLVEYENGDPRQGPLNKNGGHLGQKQPNKRKLKNQLNNRSNKVESASEETNFKPAWRKRLIGILLGSAAVIALAGAGATAAYFGLKPASTNPPYCNVTDWSDWSVCSATCGGGETERNRSTVIAGSCVTNKTIVLEETEICSNQSCPIDGAWVSWSSWNSCPVTCGSGTHSRSRTCSDPIPQYGGAACSGDATDNQNCNVSTKCPIDGAWSSWSSWSSCSVTCGSGTQSRPRNCTNPAPQYGGASCSGSASESQTCNVSPCPINGGWSTWSSWGSCSVTCATGSQSSSRTCSNPSPQYNGTSCNGSSTQTQTCTVATMCPINGGWSAWSPWGSCSASCGSGSQSSSRTCSNPSPQYNGTTCNGSSTQTQTCNSASCVTVNVDNTYSLYVDGTLKGSGTEWSANDYYTFPNTVCLFAVNALDQGGGMWGIRVTSDLISTGTLSQWKCKKASQVSGTTWIQVSYDDSSWPTAVAGNTVFTPTIWASGSSGGDRVYCRGRTASCQTG